MKSHEAMVQEFFDKCKRERPTETARVFEEHVVLTEDQLKYRQEHELFAFNPETDDDGMDQMTGMNENDVTGMTSTASIVRHLQIQEDIELAERRGEPWGGLPTADEGADWSVEYHDRP